MKIISKKKINLILIHGVGFNKKIWYFLKKKFNKKFKIYTINLYLSKKKYNFNIDFKNFIKKIIYKIPKNSILIGWSIGGLIATIINFKIKKNIILLITICSSPCFKKKKKWPGINTDQINKIKNELFYNYKNSIKNFLNLQKNNKNLKKINILYKKIINKKKPNYNSLKFNIKILKKIDVRHLLKKIKTPILRIYGNLDSIVPIKISKILDSYLNQKSYIIKNSNHAPFISHEKIFYNKIIKFIKKYIN
ncbi:alpha/beta fold hydrolase [Buchnera aphidicola]|uniref:alpha/beta fold hydrolase n=1 Tax=Buchnera aphidicola TaxID=9 RepID=UPI0031B82B85